MTRRELELEIVRRERILLDAVLEEEVCSRALAKSPKADYDLAVFVRRTKATETKKLSIGLLLDLREKLAKL